MMGKTCGIKRLANSDVQIIIWDAGPDPLGFRPGLGGGEGVGGGGWVGEGQGPGPFWFPPVSPGLGGVGKGAGGGGGGGGPGVLGWAGLVLAWGEDRTP